MPKEISFIHFSDLHVGQKWATQYLPNAKELVVDDLNFICEKLGKIDVVFFTGDIVQSGSESEYNYFLEWFKDIYKCISRNGNSPYCVFVPGNHDLERSNDTDNSTHKIIKDNWLNDENLRDTLIWDKNREYNQYCVKRFEAYSAFLEKFYKDYKKPEVYREGVLPGDFYAQLTFSGMTMGVVGLNSSFLQVDGGNYQKKLGIYHKQINGIFGNEDYISLLKGNDFSLLLTHHAPEWYEPSSMEDYNINIFSGGKFVEHLCGHNHVPRSIRVSYDYGTPQHISLAPSLFGVELVDSCGRGTGSWHEKSTSTLFQLIA